MVLARNLHNSQRIQFDLEQNFFSSDYILPNIQKKPNSKVLSFPIKTQYLIFKCYNMMQRFPW